MREPQPSSTAKQKTLIVHGCHSVPFPSGSVGAPSEIRSGVTILHILADEGCSYL